MKLSFPVDQIATEFIEPFQNADGPPVMRDFDDYDPTEPDAILVDLIEHNLAGGGSRFALASQWMFGDSSHFVAANGKDSSDSDQGDWMLCNQFPMSDLIAMLDAAKLASNAAVEIDYSGTPSEVAQAVRAENQRMSEVAKATEQQIKDYRGKKKREREY